MNAWKILSIASVVTLIGLYGCHHDEPAHNPGGGGPQPMMKVLRASCTRPAPELEDAAHNKAGHRVKAIELINQAIVEVDKGIASGGTSDPEPKEKHP